MSNYLEDMEVLNETSECVAMVTTTHDMTRKNFDDCNVVFRTAVKEGSVNDIAEYIVGYIYHNPEMFTDSESKFKFAFPFYGGAVIEIRCTGKNFSDYAYMDMVFVVGLVICAVVRKHLQDMYHSKDGESEALERVGKIMNAITNAKTEVAKLGDRVTLQLPGYDKLQKKAVAV